MRHLIRIEGCNFGTTVYDTDDLSTIRGAGLAHLRHADEWPKRLAHALPSITPIVIGASDGVYRVDTNQPADEIADAVATAISAAVATGDLLDATRPALTFTHAVAPESDNYAKDLALLTALCRVQQLQRSSVDIPPSKKGVTALCPYDRTRPADTLHVLQDGTQELVSASVDARRSYGRKARQRFYMEEIGTGEESLGFTVADSFHELVADNPVGLPPSLTGKLAVIYLDGNRFTKIREAVIFGNQNNASAAAVQDRHAAFANRVREARRQMLRRLLETLSADTRMLLGNAAPGSAGALKFETLLWGGDEALFVLPAWKLMEALALLARELEDPIWQLDLALDDPNVPGAKRIEQTGYKLSHAVGIVLCSIKTPIAVSRKLAQEVADEAKKTLAAKSDHKALPNVYSLQILESVEPPRADLAAFRRHLYATDKPAAFTLTGASDVDAMLAAVRNLQAEKGGLPRSQLFKLIGKARKQGLLAAGQASEAELFIGRDTPENKGDVIVACRRSKCRHFDLLRGPHLGYTTAAPLLPLIRLAEFWDYVDPVEPQP